VTNPLDIALARLEDIPDSQLLEVSEQIMKDRDDVLRRWDKCKAEIIKRTGATDATVIDADNILCQIEWQKDYEWDAEVVAAEAPQFVSWTEEQIIRPVRKVNTRALNEYIKKLGKTAKAERLEQARRTIKKNPKFKFYHPVNDEEEAS